MDNIFDEAFSSDYDSEQELDEFISMLKEEIESDDSKATMLDGMRFRQIQFAYAVLRNITKGTDATVSYKLNEPFKTMGSVSVEGSILEFDEPEWFARAAEFASNTEVYPLAKNRVRLTFTFHGLTKPIE